MVTSLHTHSHYCDGRGQIRQVVEAAIDAGLAEIGLSSHAPLPFETGWAMPLERLPAYLEETREVQREYGDRITIWRGLEMDFIPDPHVVAFQEREIAPLDLDYLIGSVHFLGSGYPPQSYEGDPERFRAIMRDHYGNDIRAMVEDYYRRVQLVLENPRVAIVGHLDRVKRWNEDRVFFRDDEPWYRDAVEQMLQAIARTGTMVELNSSGWRKGSAEPYPAPWMLERCRAHAIPMIVTSDAHAPDEVTWGFERANECLREAGITPASSLTRKG
ncbi:MAG: histidinol-phosphatase [Chloroflexota bacterium]